MERVLAYTARAEKSQAFAEIASTEIHRARFLYLARMWLDLAETRRRILIIEGKLKPS